MADEHGEYRRAGDTAKCPACGVTMDPEAYRCPKCRIYFCFKCRRRVQPRDEQFQCMNQRCGYYGKLLCNGCIVEVPQMGDRDRQQLVEHGGTEYVIPGEAVALVYLVVLVGSCYGVARIFEHWGAGIVVGSFLAVIVIVWLNGMLEYHKPPVYKTVSEHVEVGRSKCCIACRQAVEHLR